MKEKQDLELKEEITNTFLKTVSAFANFGTGTIMFGIDDSGNVKGIDNPDSVRIDIENRINDNIKPKPDYNISIDQNKSIISLIIHEGDYKPYLYK